MMSPGTYIRLRREAAGLSLADVAGMLDTDPHVSAQRRVDWLAAIEADREAVNERIALALIVVLPIDFAALSLLVANAAGARDVVAPRICDHCGAGAIVGCRDAVPVAALRALPGAVLSMSRPALLRHCGLPDTIGGNMLATAMAVEAGWFPGIDGHYHFRPLLIADVRP